MRKRLVTCLALAIAMFVVFSAYAYPKHYKRKGPHSAPPPQKALPMPAYPADWCRNHPKECQPRSTQDQMVRSKREQCVDVKGNGDGFISPWEMNAFGGICP